MIFSRICAGLDQLIGRKTRNPRLNHDANKCLKSTFNLQDRISGHRHNWGLAQIEDVEKKSTSWLARCRGYKFHDTYAMVKGFDQQNFGQAIFQLIDPQADSPTSRVQCFVDPQAGADYLDYLLSLRR